MSIHRLLTAAFLLAAGAVHAQPISLPLVDPARARPVPLLLYQPADPGRCTPSTPCPVALLSHGYGIGPHEYAFLAEALARRGYLVASIGHAAPGDPPMDPNGDLVRQRAAMARLGAANIRFVHTALAQSYPGYDWGRTLLVGHSLGGDASSLLAATHPASIATLVTLDNRRAALPRSNSIRVLSLRAADTGADPGVLPTPEEAARFQACIVPLANSRHNDMLDDGPAELKERILAAVLAFLAPGSDSCPADGVQLKDR